MKINKLSRKARDTGSRILAICALTACSSITYGATLNVCKTACSYTTIQSAINAAKAYDTVQVGSGTFFENLVVPAIPMNILGSGEDDTVIDGSMRGTVISFADPVQLSIVGVTITNGQGGIGASEKGFGTLNVTNCIVISNLGTGIFLGHASATITGSIISHNKSRAADGSLTGEGGAIWAEGLGGFLSSTVTITNSTITRNSASDGGAVFYNGPGTLNISGSTITDNTADFGGGFWVDQFSSGTISLTNSTVANNHANQVGGAGCGGIVYRLSAFVGNTSSSATDVTDCSNPYDNLTLTTSN